MRNHRKPLAFHRETSKDLRHHRKSSPNHFIWGRGSHFLEPCDLEGGGPLLIQGHHYLGTLGAFTQEPWEAREPLLGDLGNVFRSCSSLPETFTMAEDPKASAVGEQAKIISCGLEVLSSCFMLCKLGNCKASNLDLDPVPHRALHDDLAACRLSTCTEQTAPLKRSPSSAPFIPLRPRYFQLLSVRLMFFSFFQLCLTLSASLSPLKAGPRTSGNPICQALRNCLALSNRKLGKLGLTEKSWVRSQGHKVQSSFESDSLQSGKNDFLQSCPSENQDHTTMIFSPISALCISLQFRT